jgi:hypothetical protein
LCELMKWCQMGRKVELMEGLLVHDPWEPWEGVE